MLYSNNLIPEEHFKKLSEINFHFEDGHELFWNRLWMENYELLKKHYHETGNANLKREKENTHPLFKLSNWVALERGKYHKNPRKISDLQIELLEEIGFEWVASKANRARINRNTDDEWLERITQLEEYKKIHGDCNVSQTNPIPKYKSLGKWLNGQRQFYKHGNLPEDRVNLLEDLGVIWNVEVYKFEIKIKEILDYKDKYGNYDVPVNFKENPGLGNYVYRLKTKGVKENWKINRLNEIGFKNIGKKKRREKKGYITKQWFDMLNTLKQLENVNISKNYASIPKLGIWLNNQKKAYRSDKLKEEQISALKEIGVVLSKESEKTKRWNDYIELIELFREEFGNIEITENYDQELYGWIKLQESNMLSNKLKAKKIEILKKLKVL